MQINKTQKKMVAGGIILATAALLTFPLFRSLAQKSKKDTAVAAENNDSTVAKRKSAAVAKHDRTFRIENADVEKSMKELERSMEKLEKLNLDHVEESVELAMKAIDLEKIQETVELAMKSIDFAKIQETVQTALKSVDMDKIKIQTEAALKQVDFKNVQKEMDEAMKEAKISLEEVQKINMEDVKKEMEQAKEEMKKAKIDMKQEMEKARVEIKESMKNAKVDIKESMDKAKIEIGKAKEKLGLMKEMFTQMKADGLIKDGEKFNINWKDGKLYINDKEQPQSVTDKYKKYMDLDIHLKNLDDEDNEL